MLGNFQSFFIFVCKSLGIGQSLTVSASLTVGNWVSMSQSLTVSISLTVRNWVYISQSLTVCKISQKWPVFHQNSKILSILKTMEAFER